jgi:hypothetical protein
VAGCRGQKFTYRLAADLRRDRRVNAGAKNVGTASVYKCPD